MKDRTTRPHRVAVLAIALSAALMQAGGSIAQAPAPQGSGATITVTHQSSLWNLVRPHVPKGATTMQALLAFVRLNPDAFEGGNLNRLRLGAVLQIPTTEQILAEDAKQAAQLYARHEAAWQRSQPTPPLYPIPTGAVAQPDASPSTPATVAPAAPASSPVAVSPTPAATPNAPPASTPDTKPGKPAEAGSTWLSGLGWFSVYALFAVGAWLALKPKRRKSGAADSSGDTTIHVPDTEMDAPTVVAPPTTAAAGQTTQHGGSSSKRKRQAKEHKAARDEGKATDTVIAAAAATASLNTEPGGTSTRMAQVAAPLAEPPVPVIAQPVELEVPAVVTAVPVEQVPDDVPATPVISAPVIEPPARTPQEFDAEALSMPYLPAQTAAFGLGNAPGATTRQIVVRQGEAPSQNSISDPLELRIAQALIQAYDEIGRSNQAQRIRATLPS